MIPVVTPDEMRAIDAAAMEPVDQLIRRAGAAVAREAIDMLGGTYGRVVNVIAGRGNNGADGRDAARRLAALGSAQASGQLARLDRLAPHPAHRELLVQGGWGTDTGQFGRRIEASDPGPMRIAAGPGGRLHVLDQVNRRVQVFDAAGSPIDQVGPVPETAEDLVVTGDRLWVVAQPPPGDDRRLRLRLEILCD